MALKRRKQIIAKAKKRGHLQVLDKMAEVLLSKEMNDGRGPDVIAFAASLGSTRVVLKTPRAVPERDTPESL